MTIIQTILRPLHHAGLLAARAARRHAVLLPALGGVISERSGVTNVAMEGLMLTGAFVAVVAGWPGTTLARDPCRRCIAGGLMALIHAVVSIRFRADQIISGFAINIFASGLTTFLNDKFSASRALAQVRRRRRACHISTFRVLKQHPVPSAQVLFQQNIIVYFACSCSSLAKSCSSARASACASAPSASIPRPPIPPASTSTHPLRRRHRERLALGPRRRLPLHRHRRHLQRRHDQRARLHRPRRDDLRQMDADGSLRRLSDLWRGRSDLRRQLDASAISHTSCWRWCPTS